MVFTPSSLILTNYYLPFSGRVSSIFMTISHLLAKVPVFMAMGVSLSGQFNLLVFMVFGSVIGSFIGTRLRLASNNDKLILIIKLLLSLMAIRMLVTTVAR